MIQTYYMGVTDKFYRQGRDIIAKFEEIHQRDPVEAEEFLRNELDGTRDIVKKFVLRKLDLK